MTHFALPSAPQTGGAPTPGPHEWPKRSCRHEFDANLRHHRPKVYIAVRAEMGDLAPGSVTLAMILAPFALRDPFDRWYRLSEKLKSIALARISSVLSSHHSICVIRVIFNQKQVTHHDTRPLLGLSLCQIGSLHAAGCRYAAF